MTQAQGSTLADIVLGQIREEHTRRAGDRQLMRSGAKPNLFADLVPTAPIPYDVEHRHGVDFPTEELYLSALQDTYTRVISNGAHSGANIESLALHINVKLGHLLNEYNGEAVVSVSPWNVRVRLTEPVADEMVRTGYGTFFTNGNCDGTAELGRVLSIVDRELEKVRTALQPAPLYQSTGRAIEAKTRSARK